MDAYYLMQVISSVERNILLNKQTHLTKHREERTLQVLLYFNPFPNT